MKLGYEDSKCYCCKKAYTNTLLITVDTDPTEMAIVCKSCATKIYDFMESLRRKET